MSGVPPAYRAGPFLMFRDQDGLRHAIRLNGVLGLSDGDECCETTLMLVHGGRILILEKSLDEVVLWFT